MGAGAPAAIPSTVSGLGSPPRPPFRDLPPCLQGTAVKVLNDNTPSAVAYSLCSELYVARPWQATSVLPFCPLPRFPLLPPPSRVPLPTNSPPSPRPPTPSALGPPPLRFLTCLSPSCPLPLHASPPTIASLHSLPLPPPPISLALCLSPHCPSMPPPPSVPPSIPVPACPSVPVSLPLLPCPFVSASWGLSPPPSPPLPATGTRCCSLPTLPFPGSLAWRWARTRAWCWTLWGTVVGRGLPWAPCSAPRACGWGARGRATGAGTCGAVPPPAALWMTWRW